MINIGRRKIENVTEKMKNISNFIFIHIKKKSNVAGLINSYIFADLKNNNLNTLLCTQS